jgi:uncharacterized protein (DUF427 family)
MSWAFDGSRRPAFARAPGEGEESVWDYPRPPRVVADGRHVVVRTPTEVLAASDRAQRLLETASPPTFYLPPADVNTALLLPVTGARSRCEWKGEAVYWQLAGAPAAGPVAWSYPAPRSGFGAIAGHFAFFPGRLACFVDGERARAQPGGFYGGWITREIVGPWKGEPGTSHW